MIKTKPLSYIDKNNFVRLSRARGVEDPLGFLADQFDNPDNRMGHYTETAIEIFEQMDGKIDVFVMGAGTGATINGISNYLKERIGNQVTVVLADPQGSSLYNWVKHNLLFTQEEREGHKKRHIHRTIIEGIGLNWLSKNMQGSRIDDSEKIEDSEAFNMGKYLLRHEGILIGSTTAINLSAVVKHVKRTGIKGKRIITISCDDGFRHISKFYNKDKWQQLNFELKEADVSDEMNLSFISIN